jgi:hypothetical protein
MRNTTASEGMEPQGLVLSIDQELERAGGCLDQHVGLFDSHRRCNLIVDSVNKVALSEPRPFGGRRRLHPLYFERATRILVRPERDAVAAKWRRTSRPLTTRTADTGDTTRGQHEGTRTADTRVTQHARPT